MAKIKQDPRWFNPNLQRKKSQEERFWEKVDRSGGSDACWPWMANKSKDGYGRLKINHNMVSAHRLAWFFINGELLESSIFLCHSCDNPPCVNPKHLFKGNHQLNNEDMMRKKRNGQPQGEKAGRAKLTDNNFHTILELLRTGFSHRTIAAVFDVSRSTIGEINRGATWRHLTRQKG